MKTVDEKFEDFAETPCRACMFKCPKTKMIDLFKEDQIGNIFTEFTSLQVTELDGLPQHLCQNCYQLFTQFKEFKLKCISSDQVFRQKVKVCKSKNTVNDLNIIQDEIFNDADEVISNLLPNKSRDRYLEVYNNFIKWKEAEGIGITNNSETVMLAYFNHLTKKYKASSLWTLYSMLKTTILRNYNVEIKYPKLISFLKKQSDGFVSKKSEVFEQKDIDRFLLDAPDNKFLDCKVGLIFGMYGATRADELTDIVVSDVQIRGEVIFVNIVKTKTNVIHSFTIKNEYAAYVRKYITYRPSATLTERFFLTYRNGQCTIHPIGRNKFLDMPKKIAKFLKLPNADQYSGLSFRRPSGTLLANGGADKRKMTAGEISSTSTVPKREFINVNEIKESSLELYDENIDTNFTESEKLLSSTSTVIKTELIIDEEIGKIDTSDKTEKLLQIEIKEEQDEKADIFTDTKSTEILVKTEPEHIIETFHDVSESNVKQSDNYNKPALQKNKNKNSSTKSQDESDSDWNDSDDYFNSHFSDDEKPTKKPNKKKPNKKIPTKNSTTSDTSKFEKFRCDHCDKTFMKKHRLEAHLRTHLGLNPFVCDECNVSFKRWESLAGHKKVKHGSIDDMKMFICPHEDCDRKFLLRPTLRKHLKARHSRRKCDRIICELCGQSSATPTAAKEHKYTHTGEKPFACTQCPKRFISNYQLKIHIMRHNKIKNHVCSVCGISKTTVPELKVHMINYHTKEKIFQCDECPSVFINSRNLSRHEKIVHRGIIPKYICTYCQQSFFDAKGLKLHTMRHTGEKPHACTLCDRRFIQEFALRTHMKVHPGATYIGNEQNAQRRIKQLYICTYCQQSFQQAKALKHHTMRHTGEKPHACTLCDKRFIQETALRTHMKVHDKTRMTPKIH